MRHGLVLAGVKPPPGAGAAPGAHGDQVVSTDGETAIQLANLRQAGKLATLARKPYLPAQRADQTHDAFDQSGLSSAVGADNGRQRTLLEHARYIAQRDTVAPSQRHLIQPYNSRAHCMIPTTTAWPSRSGPIGTRPPSAHEQRGRHTKQAGQNRDKNA